MIRKENSRKERLGNRKAFKRKNYSLNKSPTFIFNSEFNFKMRKANSQVNHGTYDHRDLHKVHLTKIY